jgi:hypothetical protein
MSAEKINVTVSPLIIWLNNPPLIILDGRNSLCGRPQVIPNNIESINVLKGESAIALYGAAKKV